MTVRLRPHNCGTLPSSIDLEKLRQDYETKIAAMEKEYQDRIQRDRRDIGLIIKETDEELAFYKEQNKALKNVSEQILAERETIINDLSAKAHAIDEVKEKLEALDSKAAEIATTEVKAKTPTQLKKASTLNKTKVSKLPLWK